MSSDTLILNRAWIIHKLPAASTQMTQSQGFRLMKWPPVAGRGVLAVRRLTDGYDCGVNLLEILDLFSPGHRAQEGYLEKQFPAS